MLRKRARNEVGSDMFRGRQFTIGSSGMKNQGAGRLRIAVALMALLGFASLAAYVASAPSMHSEKFNCGSGCEGLGFGPDDIIFVDYNVTNGQITAFISLKPEWVNDYVDMWNRPRNETGIRADHAILNVTKDPNLRRCLDEFKNGLKDYWVVDLVTLTLRRIG